MPRWVKRWAQMVDNPRGWTYDDATSVLQGLGFVAPSKRSGSHRWWRHPTGVRVGIPDYGHGEVAVEYIKTMVRLVCDAGLAPSGAEQENT